MTYQLQQRFIHNRHNWLFILEDTKLHDELCTKWNNCYSYAQRIITPPPLQSSLQTMSPLGVLSHRLFLNRVQKLGSRQEWEKMADERANKPVSCLKICAPRMTPEGAETLCGYCNNFAPRVSKTYTV